MSDDMSSSALMFVELMRAEERIVNGRLYIEHVHPGLVVHGWVEEIPFRRAGLTPLGWTVVTALRRWRAEDGSYESFVPPAQLVDALTLESAKAHLEAALATRVRETAYQLARGNEVITGSTPTLDSLDAWIDLLTQMTGGV